MSGEQLALVTPAGGDPVDIRGADFSPCGRYRYTLHRTWDTALPPLAFLMLNPSTADATANDPTVERCERRARAWGWGGVYVVNLFALRSTQPEALYADPAPIGPRNDSAIFGVARIAGLVICAWGEHGSLGRRSDHVVALLRQGGVELAALKLNKGGEPAHPLYLSYNLRPEPFLRGVSAAYSASESLKSRCAEGPKGYAALIAANKGT